MTFDLRTLDDLNQLGETVELECKLAHGQNGQGEVPKDFWLTYSAMANSHGGVVLLGVREKDGVFTVAGLPNPTKVRTDLFNNLNNPGKVSVNLLADSDVETVSIDDKTLLLVHIPAATRKQKPVYLNGRPGHPWIALDDLAFLHMIGGWREDRATGEAGLTAAGLLMFGRWPSIPEAFPLYFVDYQEHGPDPDSLTRWLDRVVPDGSWSGNLYDFFRRVIRKLTADLKVPFALKDGVRIDDTPVHQAVREALVNCLIHADYSDRASVLVVRSPAGFRFRNPGMMRVPVEQALHGGASDCRNRTLHQMFLLINLGERAGSGVPKIRSGWAQAGHALELHDSFEPFEHTVLEMKWAPEARQSAETSEQTSEETSEETSQRILGLLRQSPASSARQLASQLSLSQRAVELHLARLKAANKLKRVGPNKGGRWEVLP